MTDPSSPRPAPGPADVAIIGMGVLLPGARDVRAYWSNILNGTNSIREIPPERWDWRLYYDPDPKAPDKIYSRWGGFIGEIPFDPGRYGLPPVALKSVDPLQLLTLELIRQTLDDAGIELSRLDRERVAVLLGATGGLGDFSLGYGVRSELSRLAGDARQAAAGRADLPGWTEDSFPGLLLNVAAGRVANRFDFGGINGTVDAACASSLAAIYQAVNELRLGKCDLALAGGIDVMQSPFMYLCFAKTQALSPRGCCQTFDEQSDGIAISEGLAAVALKRLADAERDGDRIYAVIKGMGGSSDGRAKGLTAPRPEGQLRALRRAYQEAGYSPATVGCWEAHGTGTVAGDRAELETLSTLLSEAAAAPASCAVGSVKTLIGHTKGAAGAAGLVKAALALHQRVLPPHVGVKQPLPLLRDPTSPLMLCPQPRPWVRPFEHPRRAAVSSFGFGGINFHAALEAYESVRAVATSAEWPVELLVWRAADRAGLREQLQRLREALAAGAQPSLADLAYTLACDLKPEGEALAIIAESLPQLAERLDAALAALPDGQIAVKGVYYTETPLLCEPGAKLALLFPGQGSQYPGMLRELGVFLPEFQTGLERADAVFAKTPTGRRTLPTPLSGLIDPPRRFIEDEANTHRANLTRTEVAQPSLGAVAAGLWAWLKRLELRPELAAGHSYGEYVALHAAGVWPLETLLELSEARGRFIVEAAAGGELGTMLAVAADRNSVEAVLDGLAGITCANHNGPKQLVLSGCPADLENARQRLESQRISTAPLSVAAAFHSPLVAPARERLAEFMAAVEFYPPELTVYGNADAAPYPTEPDRIRHRLSEHLTAPVRFMDEIEGMYQAGARVFLEVGPKEVLARLTRQILGARPHLAVATDGAGGGINGLLHALAALWSQGAGFNAERLFDGRTVAKLDWAHLAETTRPTPLSSRIWWVSGGYARRSDEPARTGRAPAPAAEPQDENRSEPGSTDPAPAAFISSSNLVGAAMSPPNQTLINPLPVPSSGSGAWAMDQAMAAYQDTMRQFLQVQERVMLAYFTASNGEGEIPQFLLSAPVSPQTLSSPQPVLASAPPPAPVAAPPVSPPVAAAPASAKPAVPSAPPPAPVASSAAIPDLKPLLLKIVSERTGYPEDMVALDQDIEADLGIDSIKRVEILGLFRRSLPEPFAQDLRGEMEQVARLPTFQQILDFVRAWLDRQPKPSGQAPVRENARPFERAGTDATASAALSRHVLQAQTEPLPAIATPTLPPGLYLLTSDELGVADLVSQRLRQAGAQPLFLPDEVLQDQAHLQSWLGRRDSSLSVRAILHLSPLSQPPLTANTAFAEWRERLDRDVIALFPLLRLLCAELSAQGRLLTASGMGGRFGRDCAAGQPNGFPAAAGLVGLTKTLNIEWNPTGDSAGFCGKAIDLDVSQQPEALADALFQELLWPGGRREIGYPGGVRTAFDTVAAPLPATAPIRLQPTADWVILATGGARGITAEVLYELAPYRPTMVLVGRSPLPEAESDALRGLDTAALRQHFIRSAQGQTRPAAIERQIQAVLHAREMRATLAELTQAGARVEYRTADMSDEAEVTALLDGLYRRFGRIDAVVHGAGVLEDRLVRDKTTDSVARVLAAKADSAFLLARHLRPDTLRFLGLFTSVAGRWGNRGQADYAVANETVNRLAWLLRARWGERIKIAAFNWGPWEATRHSTGMVTPEIRRQFAARGVALTPAAAGRQFFLNELLRGSPDEVELIAGDYPEGSLVGQPAAESQAETA
ncbi:MAG: SDR family NAD(P)-dependent oxidoreductase [Candidatus Competibacteraceae bacterium]|nr:SDR family NAD(P)-dependent oxidoreductase [Candidatus Competibacteraceae bacterium]